MLTNYCSAAFDNHLRSVRSRRSIKTLDNLTASLFTWQSWVNSLGSSLLGDVAYSFDSQVMGHGVCRLYAPWCIVVVSSPCIEDTADVFLDVELQGLTLVFKM